MVVSNPVTNNTDAPRGSSNRRKKKKMQKQISGASVLFVRNQVKENLNNTITSWKSESRKEEYSSKLFRALRHVRLSSGTVMCLHSVPVRGRAVREAADHVLAMAAKGRSRWSRAILSNNLRNRKFVRSNLRRRGMIAMETSNSRFKKPKIGRLQQRTRDLSRLIPGCRKQPFPVVLEEVTDYIAALEMQVKAMAALANIFSIGSNSGVAFGAGAVNLNQLSLSQRPPPSS